MAAIKDVLFNDGEGLDYADLNSVSRVLRSQLWDYAVNLRGAFNDPTYGVGGLDRSAHLWSVGDSCAPYPSITARTVAVLPGIVQQWSPGTFANAYTQSPAALGEDAQCLTHYADVGELQTTHDVGDVSPRFDVVSVALSAVDGDSTTRDFEDAVTRVVTSQTFNKRRNATVTKTVTKGTPDTNPVLPLLPAGHVALYAVYVPALHNAAFVPEQILDFRMPLGTFSVDVHAGDMFARQAGANLGSMTRLSGALGGVNSGLGTAQLYFVPWGAPTTTNARLLGMQVLYGENCGSMSWSWGRVNANNYGGSPQANYAAPGPSWFGYAISQPNITGTPASPATEFQGHALTHDCFTNDTGGLVSLPVWISGRSNAYAVRPEAYPVGTDNKFERLSLMWTAGNANAKLSFVRFLFAGGA